MIQLLDVSVHALTCQGEKNLGVSLTSQNGRPLPAWTPGSHINLYFSNGLVRPYSLTGKGNNPFYYELCIARDNASRGGSSYVHESLRPGDVMRISEPENYFPLVPAQKVILMAAGIGITPLYAMAEELEAKGIPFVLHYYIRKRGDAAFIGELSRPLSHGFCEIWYSCEGHTPRNHLPADLLQPTSGSHLYLCGPQGFMKTMTQNALDNGWNTQNIHTELFRPTDSVESNTEEGSFTVTLASSGHQFVIPADKTIAAVLTENGIDVPLSCEMGMCGACLTPVESGRVDHRDTVQSDAEKSGGKQQIALCCSRSHSENIVITL